MRTGFVVLSCLAFCLGCKDGRRDPPPSPAAPVTPAFHQGSPLAVTVDYSIPIERVVERGFTTDTAAVDGDDFFSDRNFPHSETGKADLRMRVTWFEPIGKMTVQEQHRVLFQNGLRPATLVELLAFAAKYPCLTVPGFLVATGGSVPIMATEELGVIALTPRVTMDGCPFDGADPAHPKPDLGVVVVPSPRENNSGFFPSFYLLAVEK